MPETGLDFRPVAVAFCQVGPIRYPHPTPIVTRCKGLENVGSTRPSPIDVYSHRQNILGSLFPLSCQRCLLTLLFSFFLFPSHLAPVNHANRIRRSERALLPSFASCPGEDSLDTNFYTIHDTSSLVVPSHHWCLLAEIVDTEFIIRLRLNVRDRDGQVFRVMFYLEDDDQDTRAPANAADFRPGHTVAIMYAQRHHFLDFSTGIRQETMRTIKVRTQQISTSAPAEENYTNPQPLFFYYVGHTNRPQHPPPSRRQGILPRPGGAAGTATATAAMRFLRCHQTRSSSLRKMYAGFLL